MQMGKYIDEVDDGYAENDVKSCSESRRLTVRQNFPFLVVDFFNCFHKRFPLSVQLDRKGWIAVLQGSPLSPVPPGGGGVVWPHQSFGSLTGACSSKITAFGNISVRFVQIRFSFSKKKFAVKRASFFE